MVGMTPTVFIFSLTLLAAACVAALRLYVSYMYRRVDAAKD
jgi:hypothetical protein